jgi:serine/threonine protein phosphatase PrpC/DNA-binding transcriptional MerR regulator
MDRMTIGEFGRATGLTPKALRLYDELSLLRPAEVDERTGYRYYRAGQLDRARLVARLRLIGMPLERIRTVADRPPGAQAAEVLSYWRQVEADTVSRRASVAALVTDLRTEGTDMVISNTQHPVAAARLGAGARDDQLDGCLAGRHLYAVADGFGTDPATAETALAALVPLEAATGVVDPVRLLDDALAAAAAAVDGRGHGHPPGGAGCTLTALILGDGEAGVAHVGDSRAYLVRNRHLHRLTRDHTDVQSLVDEGRLTQDEARAGARPAALNRALVPGRSAQPDISRVATEPGDRFVLLTDGVHAVLPSAELALLLLDHIHPEELVAGVEAAVLAAGAPDNYAVVAVDLAGPDN